MNNINPYELTLRVHDYEAPCFLQLAEPSCQNRAEWVAFFGHADTSDDDRCARLWGGGPTPSPLCGPHKRFIVGAFSSFWRMWLGLTLTDCPSCGRPLKIDRIEPIKPKG